MVLRQTAEAFIRPSLWNSTYTAYRPCQRINLPIRSFTSSQRRLQDTPSSDPAKPSAPQNSSESDSKLIDDLFAEDAAILRSEQPTSENASNTEDPRRTFGSSFSPLPGSSNSSNSYPPFGRSRPLDFNRMDTPSAPANSSLPSLAPALPSEPETYPRLNASTGRSIDLMQPKGGTKDLVKGIAQLNMLLARNNVKGDFNRQRFHERPGLKRKRLKSERWRKRFKVGFRDVVGRVSELTRKGW